MSVWVTLAPGLCGGAHREKCTLTIFSSESVSQCQGVGMRKRKRTQDAPSQSLTWAECAPCPAPSPGYMTWHRGDVTAVSKPRVVWSKSHEHAIEDTSVHKTSNLSCTQVSLFNWQIQSIGPTKNKNPSYIYIHTLTRQLHTTHICRCSTKTSMYKQDKVQKMTEVGFSGVFWKQKNKRPKMHYTSNNLTFFFQILRVIP